MKRPEFPLVESVGLARHEDGWVVVAFTSRGEEIIEADIVQRPGSLKNAVNALMAAAAELGARKEKDGARYVS